MTPFSGMARSLFVGALLVSAGYAVGDEYQAYKLSWDGIERSYLLYVPPGRTDVGRPLVIAAHGAGGDARNFATETGFAAAADQFGMMVAFPEGTVWAQGGRTFNARICCGEAVTQNVDDIGFIGRIIEDVAARYPLDRARIYATGMSNGGMLVHELAAEHSDWVAAIAPVAGAIGGMAQSGETYLVPMPARPVSVMIVHGTRDRLVLYDGGSSPALSGQNHWKMSAADALSFWAAADHCPGVPRISDVEPGLLRTATYVTFA